MAISRLAWTSAQGSATSSTTTAAINTTGATLIELTLFYATAADATLVISDSAGNTWTALTICSQSGTAGSARKWYALCAGHTSTTHTFTASAGATMFGTLFVAAYAAPGVTWVGEYGTDGATYDVAADTWHTYPPYSVTPGGVEALLTSGICTAESSHVVMGVDALTLIGSQYDLVTGVSYGGAAADEILSPPAARSITWYWQLFIPLRTAAVFAVYASTAADPIEGSFVAGEAGRVGATNAALFAMSGDPAANDVPYSFKVVAPGGIPLEGDTRIAGDLEVEGDTLLDGDVTVLGTLTAPGVPGAPLDASYVTLSADTELTAERVLTAGTGITITDGGPGSTVTIATSVAASHYDCPLSDGDLTAAEIIFAAGQCVIVQVPL